MPRESSHIYLANKLLHKLPELDREIFLIGSVIHDSPYFLKSGEALGYKLHGADGEDTIKPIVEIARRSGSFDGLSLACGMLSHVALDQIFHPAVYYFTGNYLATDPKQRKRAQSAHRRFEVKLDLSLPESQPMLHRILSRETLKTVIELLPPVIKWKRAISLHSRVDRLSRSRPIGRILKLSEKRLPKPIRELLTLSFIGQIPLDREHPLKFQNPVTGIEYSKTIQQMFEEAELRAESYIRLLLAGESLPVGASLNFDVVGAKREDAKYFATAG